MNRTLATAATAVAVALGSIVGLSGAAGAAEASATGWIKRTTTSYSSPSNASIPVHTPLVANEPVDVLCFTEGQVLDGNPYGFRIDNDGERGFVHRDAIAPPTGLRHC